MTNMRTDNKPVEWPPDPFEGFCLRRDEGEEGDEPRSLYEKYPMDSSYYEDPRFL